MRPFRRPSPLFGPLRRSSWLVRPLGAATVALALAATTAVAVSVPAAADGRATPGDFTGYGFDQCVAPTQAKMDRWLTHSPYFAVGIYISGNSRACRDQPNLTPTWVDRQLRAGWRLLPITLGPQSTCVGRYPRYGPKIDPTISNSSTNDHAAARAQGSREANVAVYAARQLGIAARSTLWYDLEGWGDYRNATCRESALAFLSAWTTQLHRWNYVSGTYSSAGSGMRILDDARYQRRADVVLPDRIWIARWDGKPNTSTSYIREDGWRPGNRMKQYRGGHDETYGGVTINIDSDFLDLGRGSYPRPIERRCGGVLLDLPAYWPVGPGSTNKGMIQALQCFLRAYRMYTGPVDGVWTAPVQRAANTWQRTYGMPVRPFWARNDWIAMLSRGGTPVLKIGSAGDPARRLQRALNASGHRLALDAVVNPNDSGAVRAYQRELGLPATGVAYRETWLALMRGRY